MSEPSILHAITRLRVSHFRSHKAVDLYLDGRSIAIFGCNGSGKTNLMEAVSLLSPGRGMRRASPGDLERAPEHIGWRVEAVLHTPDGERLVQTGSRDTGRLVQIDDKSVAQTALGRATRILWLTPAMDRLWSEGASERRRFLDRIAMSMFPDHAAATIGYEKSLRQRNRLLREEYRDESWFDALEAQMASFGIAVGANRKRAIAKLDAATQEGVFPSAELRLETAVPEEEDLYRADLARQRRADLAAGRSLLGPHRDELTALYRAKQMPAHACSTGEQKALLISLILANARVVATDFGAPPILLLDEVAAHLDAARRAALFDIICDLGAQAWMSGTGRELFEGLGERAQWLHMAERDGVSFAEIEEAA